MRYIYKITNLINNKIYIGQTNNPIRRWEQHISYAELNDNEIEELKEKEPLLIDKKIRQYKIENFIFEVITSIIPTDNEKNDYYIANDVETDMIKQESSHISLQSGYNVALGGCCAPKTEEWKIKTVASRRAGAGYDLSEKTKKQMSENWTKDHPQNSINKAVETRKWYKHSEETKRKISEDHKGNQYCLGNKQTQEHINKRMNTIQERYGNFTGELKCNVIDCDRTRGYCIDGIKYCDTHIMRLKKTGTLELLPKSPAWNKGKSWDEKTKQKLSISLKGREVWNKIYFTDEQVSIILTHNKSISEIAKDFDVSPKVIKRIRKEYSNK